MSVGRSLWGSNQGEILRCECLCRRLLHLCARWIKQVDALVHYLRRVHLLCYYRAEEYNDVGDMIRKGAATLVRPKLDGGNQDEGKETEWERSLTSKVRRRIAQVES